MGDSVSDVAAEKGYEPKDVRFRPFIFFVAGFIATAILINIALFGGMKWLSASHDDFGNIRPPQAQESEKFPTPRLQVNPRNDLVDYQDRENGALNSYGWIDRSKGVVRIPIEQAISLVVQRGFPVRPSELGATEVEVQRQKGAAVKIPPAAAQRKDGVRP